MRRIKRTKITVIRTEAFFLKTADREFTQKCLQISTDEFLENDLRNSVIEIEPINRTEPTNKPGEKK